MKYVGDLNKLNLVKLGYGGLVLGSSQFLLLPQNSNVIKTESEIIISIHQSKSVIQYVEESIMNHCIF